MTRQPSVWRWPGPRALRELEKLRNLIPDLVTCLEVRLPATGPPEVVIRMYVTTQVAAVIAGALTADEQDQNQPTGNGGNEG